MPQTGTTVQAVKFGETPVLSGNGRYIAFVSSSNLYQPAGQGSDVFLLDLTTQQSQIVSVSPQGESGNAFAFFDSLSISADGRYVAFASDATNLVPNDLNGETDVFIRDTLTGMTILASVSSTGAQLAANTLDFTLNPGISANGQFVVFQSGANNLVPNDTNNDDQDIFVRDLIAGSTTRVSVNSNGDQTRPWNRIASADSRNASISGDGRYVAFESNAINLDPRDTGANNFDIFVHDRQTGQTRQVSVNSLGQVAAGASLVENSIGYPTATNWSSDPVISANGRYVVFQSGATNLVANDTNDRVDIFRHDLETNETILISAGVNGSLANGGSSIGYSRNGAISSDGRYVVFQSFASNLVADDNNNALDVFVRDVLTGTTERISVNSSGQEAVGGAPTSSSDGTISDDGRYVAFASLNANLANNSLDPFIVSTYLRDRQTTGTTPPPITPAPTSSPTYNSGWVSNLLGVTTPANSLVAGSSIPTGTNGVNSQLPGATSSQAWSQWF
jgi:hypothetical protein